MKPSCSRNEIGNNGFSLKYSRFGSLWVLMFEIKLDSSPRHLFRCYAKTWFLWCPSDHDCLVVSTSALRGTTRPLLAFPSSENLDLESPPQRRPKNNSFLLLPVWDPGLLEGWLDVNEGREDCSVKLSDSECSLLATNVVAARLRCRWDLVGEKHFWGAFWVFHPASRRATRPRNQKILNNILTKSLKEFSELCMENI